jgi:hypothetical protein
MTEAPQRKLTRLRALCAVALLLFGFVSAPIGLAGNLPDVCSMLCCVEEGHCCCNPHRAFVKGQMPDGKPALGDEKVASGCPEECANPPASPNLMARKAVRSATRLIDFSGPSVISFTQEIGTYFCFESSSAPPRAPPLV